MHSAPRIVLHIVKLLRGGEEAFMSFLQFRTVYVDGQNDSEE